MVCRCDMNLSALRLYASPMKRFLYLPFALFLGLSAFAQTEEGQVFQSLFEAAVHPFEGMTQQEIVSYQNPFGAKYNTPEKAAFCQSKSEPLIQYIHYPDDAATSYTEKKNADFELHEFILDGILIRSYWPDAGGLYTECLNAKGQVILIYQSNFKPYNFSDWAENLNPDYWVYDGLVLFEYAGNTLKHVMKYDPTDNGYYLDEPPVENLPVPLPLIDPARLDRMASPMISSADPGVETSEYPLLMEDCHHGHICCETGCLCCRNGVWGSFYTGSGEDGPAAMSRKITSDRLLHVSLRDGQNPTYRFTDSNGNLLYTYYSTLSNKGFRAAYNGSTEYFEYNEEGIAMVKAAGGGYCRIDKNGDPVPFEFTRPDDAEFDTEKLSDNLYAVMVPIHDHLPREIRELEYVWEVVTALFLVDSTGKLVQATNYNTILKLGENLWAVGELNVAFGYDWHPEIKYVLVDRDFKRVTTAEYTQCGIASDGLPRVCRDGLYGFIDASGNEVIPCRYEKAEEFRGGFAKVTLKGETFTIDKHGHRVN
jgi:hypothetical protein